MRKKLVGKYELGKILGQGNFAKVKLARNIETNELVAIKILNRDQVLQHKMVEQIKREISTMKVIKHSNVVKLYEVIASKTKIYIVLELVDGGEFFDIIAKNGRLKEEEARKYFQQLIDAVDFCHSRGVYHRDLKLDNLLVDSCGVLKVADFGLSTFSQQVREDGLLHTACGTPNYVAPEVFTDKGYDGTAADVWSCGIILFVLLAGYFPFDDENLINLHNQILNGEFIVPPWLSFGAKRLIRCILDPNPLTRMTISEIMEDDWFKKDYNPPCFDVEEDVKFDDIDVAFNNSEENLITKGWTKPVPMNAFELISGSQSFNLESLFLMEPVPGVIKQETRFTSQSTANEIMSKIEEAANSLNFTVVKQNYKIKLQGYTSGRKGCFSVIIEVFEVAQSFHVVELRNIGGDTLEFHKFFEKVSLGLKDAI
ncbi:CBL-interacting serine/threonine-protein kinase 9-like isoform X1 [Amaranthus tricolor]|uniref:CBL-interacting serine/threonine-protein kinase 9-like isoform X1 n=1 Tax=Amaranthus tricolor TaxID=29722 RepID=UPI00258469CD|nr:CBL-interacting serine/threonine-protein kinase 9-like isoform X1 [Amaranthus tricolor]